jgi:hypothetical protein
MLSRGCGSAATADAARDLGGERVGRLVGHEPSGALELAVAHGGVHLAGERLTSVRRRTQASA